MLRQSWGALVESIARLFDTRYEKVRCRVVPLCAKSRVRRLEVPACSKDYHGHFLLTNWSCMSNEKVTNSKLRAYLDNQKWDRCCLVFR
jgi:hypothetical protein